MPTKHRRIAVVEDPELKKALTRASSQFPGSSSAGLLRRLAMLGAETLEEPQGPPTKLERLLSRPGVRPARGNLKEFLAKHGDRSVPEGADPLRGTKALEEQREERL